MRFRKHIGVRRYRSLSDVVLRKHLILKSAYQWSMGLHKSRGGRGGEEDKGVEVGGMGGPGGN